MAKKTLLTGDRPTGPLHLGHFVGSLKNRVLFQNQCDTFIMLADAQAITDNYKDINKVKTSIHEVVCDYLAVGIDPVETCIFIQSLVPAVFEMTAYFLNLVTIQYIGHNPTVKQEIKMRGFKEGVPAGFYLYPIYQTADILAFRAHIVPVGHDQAPMIELTRDIAERFNKLYHTDALQVPEAIYPKMEGALPGIDGQKMSKSLGNAIYLKDNDEEIIHKVKKMKSDPNRLSIDMPGDPEKAIAFQYLDAFDPEPHVKEALKERYRQGGVSDKEVKERTIQVLIDLIKPIRERREKFHKDPLFIQEILRKGTIQANERALETLSYIKKAMGIDYFSIPQ